VRLSVIVPTRNEEKRLPNLLKSLSNQSFTNYEIIVVDNNSTDKTILIAKNFAADVIRVKDAIKKGGIAYLRNLGGYFAKGDILVFTEADVIAPQNWLMNIFREFSKDCDVIAVAGPGVPYDAPLIGFVEYGYYNFIRSVSSRLLKIFSTSGYNISVRSDIFKSTQGFDTAPINDDGLFGKKIRKFGKVKFSWQTFVFISARRMKNEGFVGFNRHYLFMLENFFPLQDTLLLKKIKAMSIGAFYDKKRE
jgi:glycosyltransferase involved in cell wall biosynthesis